jgi:hypothetical protein
MSMGAAAWLACTTKNISLLSFNRTHCLLHSLFLCLALKDVESGFNGNHLHALHLL